VDPKRSLYILVKHNHNFMGGHHHHGVYSVTQGNPAMMATNRSGERIFSTVNRVLSSHGEVRAPIIAGIVKIRALGEAFFKQAHEQYASCGTWNKARELLNSTPTQRELSTARLAHWEDRSGQRQQVLDKVYIPLLDGAVVWLMLISFFPHNTGRAQEEDPRVTKILTFLAERNVAMPTNRRLTVKFMLDQLRQLKQLGATTPAQSLSLASSSSPY
jgi:hypothetical protein